MSLNDEIRAALDLDNPEDTVRRLKRAIANELRILNVNARVIDTHYFNHTFTPDFVVRWNGGGRQREERPVYLRFESERDYYPEDLEILGEQNPILLGLEVSPEDHRYPNEIDSAAVEKDAMVISSNAVEHLARERTTEPFARLVSSSIGEAGRGAIDEQRAEEATQAAVSTFAAARQVNAAELSSRLDTLTGVLSESKAHQLSSFLEAVWVGSGGVSTEFPRSLSMSGRLTTDQWQFLLEFENVEDDSFWRGLGAGLNLEQLGHLSVHGFSPNLQALVAANWDRLSPRVARVLPDQARLDAPDVPRHYWSISSGSLCLRGPESTVYVAVDQQALTVDADKKDGPTVAQLLQRQRRTAFDVVEVLFVGSKRTLDFSAEEGALTPEEITEKGGIMGREGRVKKASIRLPDDRKLALDFTTSTAGGQQAMHPLKELVIATEGFLVDASEEDLAEVVSLLPDVQQQMLTRLQAMAPRLELRSPLELESGDEPPV
jgi:hypothetical protein